MEFADDSGMTVDPSTPRSSRDPSDEWADAGALSDPACQPPAVEDGRVPIQPRLVVSPRRREAAKAMAESEGLRIAPRVRAAQSAPPDHVEPSGSRPKIEVQEIGKEIVRLESAAAAPYVERQDPLPKLQPRPVKPHRRESGSVADWGKAASNSYQWLGWGGLGVALLVLAGLLIQPRLQQKGERAATDDLHSLRVVEDVVRTEDPTVFFEQNPVQVVEEIHQALTIYARARTLDEARPVIRHAEKLGPRLSRAWKSWNVSADWAISDSDVISYDSVGKVPYAMITGTRPDFSRYRVFLVREDGRMQVDWEASEGLCSHSVQELNDPGLAGAEVRVDASPVAYYTLAFPEDRYRAFRLVLGESEDFIWGYVEKGSPADLAMEDIFMEKRQFSDKPASGKVRLRLRRGDGGAMANQWLILDVLHKGWVTP